MVVEHLVGGDQGSGGGREEYLVSIVALSKLTVSDRPDPVVILDGVSVEGRLEDDNGAGIEGEGTIELLINGEQVEVADAREGGFFTISHTVDRFTRTGTGAITVRFRDLKDERSGWYRPSEVTWSVSVRSRTYMEVVGDPVPGDFNLTVHLTDEKGAPVGWAPVQFGIGLSYKTRYTDQAGNLTVDFNGTLGGDQLFLRFPGDPSRFLLGTSYNTTIPVIRGPDRDLDMAPFLIMVLIAIVVAAVAAMYIRARKLRRDSEHDRLERMEKITLYPFDPPGRTNKAVYESYRSVNERLRAGGSPRPESMTPREYSDVVRDGAPELKELEGLTKLFEEARYSDHEMSAHLMGMSKEMELRLLRTAEALDLSGLRSRVSSRGSEAGGAVQRPQMPRLRVDHGSDLRELLGDKGVQG
jgi:hypothetical protein